MKTSIAVPAEAWETLSESYSAHLAVEQKGSKPVGVKATKYKGYLHTVFSVMFGSWGSLSRPTINAYRLLPESMYEGDTTPIYHDKDAIAAGRRERGDHTGLIVSVKGSRMVCAEPVEFVLGLPTTRPLTLAEAQEFDALQQAAGWRALFYKGAPTEWGFLDGHPVVRYLGGDDSHATLFWKRGKTIEELSISDEIQLESLMPEVLVVPQSAHTEQLVLF